MITRIMEGVVIRQAHAQMQREENALKKRHKVVEKE